MNTSLPPSKVEVDTVVWEHTILDFRNDTFEVFGTFTDKQKAFAFSNSLLWIQESFEEFDVNYSIEWLDVTYSTKATKYKYKLFFEYRWVNVMSYHEGTSHWVVETKNHIRIEWKWLVLLWVDFFVNILKKYFTFDWFRRLDVFVDLKLPLEEVLSHFKELKQSWNDMFWNMGQLITHYIWKYKTSENRYKLIRIYNKLLEIKWNKTQKLYGTPYLEQKHVTRIEIEFRQELCKNITFENFQDIEFLKNLFITHIQKHTKIFDHLQTEKIKLTRAKKKNSFDWLSPEEILTTSALRMFKWLWRNILEQWVCPLRVLIDSWSYSKQTLLDIAFSIDDDWVLDTEQFEFYRKTSNLFDN